MNYTAKMLVVGKLALILAALMALFASMTLADVPNLISYQGRLNDAGGNPVPDSTYTITFSIYASESTPTGIWYSGMQPVAVENGQFSYMLGTVNPLPTTLFNDTVRWLGIRIGSDPEIDPRTRLVTVPYAFNAKNGGGWTDVGDTVRLMASSDLVGIGTDSPTNKLEVIASGTEAAGYFQATGNTLRAYSNVINGVPNAYAVYGRAAGGDGNNTGLYGLASDANNGFGVYGYAHTNTSNSVGVVGLADGAGGASDYNTGVYGEAQDGVNENTGVYSSASGSGATNYGIYSTASGGTTNYAGYFAGDVHITGTLTGGKSSIRIDHPNDPENAYLQHSFVNSPEMMNVYNGNITTDGNGEATVTLPDYFEALNDNYRYQLTVIGTFSQAIIAEKINGNRFVIKTDKPFVEVSWQVTGIRADAYAKSNRMQVEIDKPENEIGKYLAPEALGYAPELHINYEHRQNDARPPRPDKSEE